LPGDFPGDEALGDVSRFHIKMAVDRADLAGDVEAWNRLFHRVEHPLFYVMLGAALGVVDEYFTQLNGWVREKRATELFLTSKVD